jgi:hypothetical protein
MLMHIYFQNHTVNALLAHMLAKELI